MSEIEKYENALKEEMEKVDEATAREVLSNEEKFWQIVSRVKILQKEIYKLRIIWELIKDYVSGNYREVPWSIIAAVVAVILYILNPLDLIPDAIPGVGYVDDALVLGAAWKFAENDLRKYAKWKCNQSELPPSLKEAIDETFRCEKDTNAES